ncbi:MAG: hypothetical protein V1907_04885 [Candidatus Kerfeldbacteria bacterium]
MNSLEVRWVWKITLLAIVLANLPFAIAAVAAPHGTVYTGISSVAPGDLNVYLSYLEQVRQGHFILRDLFTAEPQPATLINPFWLTLGLLGSVLRLAPLATYIMSRIILGGALLFLIYRFAAYFFDDVLRRRAAFLLAVFASGIGAWVEPVLRAVNSSPDAAMPMDLWVSEAFTFLSLRHSPHFIMVTILIIATAWLMIRSAERSSMKDAVFAGLCMLALYSFHPFHVVSFAYITVGTLITLFIIRRHDFVRDLGRYSVMWFIASPAIMYHVLLIVYDPFAKGRSLQNILVTTQPLLTLASYGLLFVGAVVGATILFRTKTIRHRMLVVWAMAHMAAIYAPVFFNRRVTHGLNIALAMCAAAAVPFVISKIRTLSLRESIRTPLFAVIAFLALGISNVWVQAQDLSFFLREGRTTPSFFYMGNDYRGAFTWLERNGNDSTVVLSGTIIGNFVPGRSGRRVVVGHNVETVDIQQKLPEVRKFFTPATDDSWRQAYLARNNVTHVLLGPRERALGYSNTEKAPYLISVYSYSLVTLYSVSL